MTNFSNSDWATAPQSDAHPVIVCSADENYAKCLAVTATSLLKNCSQPKNLRLTILDGGISDESQNKLYRSLEPFGADIQWITPRIPNLDSFPTSGHISAVSYFRIFLGSLLPANVGKVIYLDSDLAVEHDIFELWKIPLGDSICTATQDLAAPYFDSQVAAKNYLKYWRLLAATRPVANFQELGLHPNSEYFNAGVLCLNLNLWRTECIEEKLLQCIQENVPYMRWWDQYLLNVVLNGRWKRLDPRWNQTPSIFAYSSWYRSPFDKETYITARSAPYIRHYASHVKPWHFGYQGPGRNEFFKYLDMTEWAGWRPSFNIGELKRCTKFEAKNRLKLLRHQFSR